MIQRLLASLVLLSALAGCQPDGPPPQANKPLNTDVLEVGPEVSPNGMLTVDPAVVDACREPEGIVASKVSWNASSAGTEGAEVWLQNPGEEKKLWSAGGAIGASTTGRWMRNDTTVILVNGEDKRELARITIKFKPCNR